MNTTSTNYPGWMSQDIPSVITRLDENDSKRYLDLFRSLTEERCYKGISFPWPIKPGFRTVAIQDGFDLSTLNATNLEVFFNAYSSPEVVFWATYDLNAGVYKTNYSGEARDWISSEFIISPVSMLSVDAEIIIIINEQLSFTLICADDKKITYLESLYKSEGGMESSFKKSLNDYFRNSQNSDHKWICETVLPFCKWD